MPRLRGFAIIRAMTERRPLTILFADVSGSTRLFETRGDEAARRIVANVLLALAEVSARHGGRVIKTIGDEIMCTFPGPLHGLLAATDNSHVSPPAPAHALFLERVSYPPELYLQAL